MIAKRVDSRYRAGRRTPDWLKVKLRGRQEFVDRRLHARARAAARAVGALVLARPGRRRCVWAGNVGTGFADAEIERLLALLRPLERETPPFATAPRMPRVRQGDVTWVEPELVGEVEFGEWTHGRPPPRARRTSACARTRRPGREARGARASGARGAAGASSSSRTSTRSFWPEEGITKGDLLAYYRDVAPVLVPHLRDRPFTMKRYPDGIARQALLPEGRADAHAGLDPDPPFPVSTRERRASGSIDFPLVNDELALLWMVNMGCIDMNTWYSRVDRPDRPDFVLFDLDPTDGVGFAEVRRGRAARRGGARRLALESFPKTSGARRHPRARADRAAPHLRGHAAVRRDRRATRSRERTRGS